MGRCSSRLHNVINSGFKGSPNLPATADCVASGVPNLPQFISQTSSGESSVNTTFVMHTAAGTCYLNTPRPLLIGLSRRASVLASQRLGGGVTGVWGLRLMARFSSAGTPETDPVKFFETSVRPVLAENCFKCHSELKQKGGLRLDSRAAILRGGDSGPAVVPGEPGESLLIQAINHDGFSMPPSGKLKDDERAALSNWVKGGAAWPETGHSTPKPMSTRSRTRILTDDDRAFWSFQPVRSAAVPEVADGGWSRNPIDRFIAARLASEGLVPGTRGRPTHADPPHLVRPARPAADTHRDRGLSG